MHDFDAYEDTEINWRVRRGYGALIAAYGRPCPIALNTNVWRIDHSGPRLRIETSKGADAVSRHMAELYAKARPGGVVDLDLPWAYPRQGARFTGKVYLLVNRHSFSNTVNVAALVQDYGFGRVLGEETSDMATTYGAMEQFRLPITGISVGYPKAHIIRVNGDPVSRGVVPDVAIRTPIAPRDRDVVLDQALAIAAKGG